MTRGGIFLKILAERAAQRLVFLRFPNVDLSPAGPATSNRTSTRRMNMARMKRGARSQAVRDYLAEYPQASPKEIVEGLKARGIKVKVTLVNSIKYKKPAKGGRRRAPSMRVAARKAGGTQVTIDQLLEVKRLADSLGGVDHLRKAMEVLEQFR